MRSTLFRSAVLTLALTLGPVGVAAAAPTPPDADALVPVSGTVTDAASGDPVAGVCVGIRTSDYPWWDQRTCTDDDGSYAFSIAPGRYQVQFDDPIDALGLQWWPMVSSPLDAEWVVVRRGTPVTGIDGELAVGATMTGRAFEGTTGEPMADACIRVSSAGVEDHVGFDQVPTGGQWTVRGLPATDVTVRVERCNRQGRLTWAYDALTIEDATTFATAAGGHTEVGRLELLPGATLRGKVTAGKERIVPSGFGVGLDYVIDGRSGEPPQFGAKVRANGTYVIRDVQPGLHNALAYDLEWPRTRWANEWSGGATSYGRAEVFELDPGGSGRMDFHLGRGAVLEITLDGNLGGDYLSYELHSDDFDTVGDRAILGGGDLSDGVTLRFRGMPPAPTALCLANCRSDPDGWWYEDAEVFSEATLADLRRGQTTRITVHLPD